MSSKPSRSLIHLAQFLVHGPTHHSLAMWRHPLTRAASQAHGWDWRRPELYQHIAQTCERGCFDMVFFADLNYIADTYTGSMAPALQHATQAPEHDPLPLLSFMAAATKHIGLASTLSVSHHHPFYAARLWATLDHLTNGRAGWNVVTSLNSNQSANYGETRANSDLRYDRAHEFMEVCRALWNSWDKDALVDNPDVPMMSNPDKVRRIEFEGQFFKSRGPLNVARSPQNGPAILQAGVSPKGRDFAAKYADGIFAIQPNADEAKKYFTDIKARIAELGGTPEHCRMLFGMQPFVGESEAHAQDLRDEHNALVADDGGLAILSAHTDFDLATIDLDKPMAEIDEPRLDRMQSRAVRPDGTSMSAREVARRHGQSVSLPQFVGTAESVADQMEAFIDHVGGDGFMVSMAYCPGALEAFVDHVVPVLQKRGRMRTRYTGSTLRDTLKESTAD
ncbi:MAG: NtaA/DmoA family FMN-dependent monooxygenase [Pseudomonadota bacterium]